MTCIKCGAELPPGAAAALEETAAFLSPVFEDAERTRRPVRGIPRIESHARTEDGAISLPRGCLDAAREALSIPDLVLAANEMRSAAEALGRILGKVYSEDLLDALFSRFCVGK